MSLILLSELIFPTETWAQIMSRLVVASSNRTARGPNLGWSRVNLASAVGALAN